MDDPNQETTPTETVSYSNTWYEFSHEILSNPLNVILLSISAFLIYKILVGRQAPKPRPEPEVELPRMKKKDLTLEELKQYNGTGKDGRICIAVNWRIYDVTRGKTFYGPGGPYSIFAGRDASRALALFTVSESALKNEDDDLSDLTLAEMNRMKEWQIQLEEKYDFVGRLLRPGQEPVDYTDSEDELNDDGETSKKPLVTGGEKEVDGDHGVNTEAQEAEKNVDDVEEGQDDEEIPQQKDKPKEDEAIKTAQVEEKSQENEKVQEKQPEEKRKEDKEIKEETFTEKTEL